VCKKQKAIIYCLTVFGFLMLIEICCTYFMPPPSPVGGKDIVLFGRPSVRPSVNRFPLHLFCVMRYLFSINLCHKYSSREWTLLKSLSRSEVKVRGQGQGQLTHNSGGMHFDGVIDLVHCN